MAAHLGAQRVCARRIHTQRGKVTLQYLLEIYTKHVDHHLRFVHGKRAAMGAATM